MTVNIAAIIETMEALGHKPADILAVVKAASSCKPSSGAERTRRWREKKAGNVTSDVTVTSQDDDSRARVVNTNLPSGDINITYPSDRTGKPVSAGQNPKTRLWSEGVPAVIALGVPERQARSVIGGWLKSSTPESVLDAIAAAQRECPMAPIPWITAALRPAARAGPSRGKPSVTDAILEFLAEGQPR